MDQVRVLRILEYTGPRDAVEYEVSKSIHGSRDLYGGVVVRATTIGNYPEILEGADDGEGSEANTKEKTSGKEESTDNDPIG